MPKWTHAGSLNPFKIHSNPTLDPRCATRCPRASLNHQNCIPRSSNAPSIPSKFQIWVLNMTPYSYQHPANQPATPCKKGGRRQGRSLKIYIYRQRAHASHVFFPRLVFAYSRANEQMSNTREFIVLLISLSLSLSLYIYIYIY